MRSIKLNSATQQSLRSGRWKLQPATNDGEMVTQAADEETVDLPALLAGVTSEAFDWYMAVNDEA